MLKLRILILLLAPFVLSSLISIQRDEFKKEVEAYVDLLLSSYDNTNETLHSFLLRYKTTKFKQN